MTFEPIGRFGAARLRELHALYQGEWWSRGRTLDDVRRMLAGTDVVVAFRERRTCRLAAFARALTDGVYKALVLDVIVAAPYRKVGLGRSLVEAILDHPRLRRVEMVELYCKPDLIPFYRRWGFTERLGDVIFMRRTSRRRRRGRRGAAS